MADPPPDDQMALSPEQVGFQLRIRAIPADPPSGRDDAVVGEARDPREAHDIAYCAGGARTAGHFGHIAVGRYPTRWDALQDAEHSLSEYGGRRGTVHDGACESLTPLDTEAERREQQIEPRASEREPSRREIRFE